MTAAVFLQSHRAPQHSTAQLADTTVHAAVSRLHCEILYVFWELLLRLSRESWEPFEGHQSVCCFQERSAAGSCDHLGTLTAGGGQTPAQHWGDEGESGWILFETCSLMSFNPCCIKGVASSTSAYQVGKWRLLQWELVSWPTRSQQAGKQLCRESPGSPGGEWRKN